MRGEPCPADRENANDVSAAVRSCVSANITSASGNGPFSAGDRGGRRSPLPGGDEERAIPLAAATTVEVRAGDVVRVLTPGRRRVGCRHFRSDDEIFQRTLTLWCWGCLLYTSPSPRDS